MRKISKITIILGVLFSLIAIGLFLFFSDTFDTKITGHYTWTKAICDGEQCQDYEITCKKNDFVEMKPIVGAVIQISENWSDPRTSEEINRLCE